VHWSLKHLFQIQCSLNVIEWLIFILYNQSIIVCFDLQNLNPNKVYLRYFAAKCTKSNLQFNQFYIHVGETSLPFASSSEKQTFMHFCWSRYTVLIYFYFLNVSHHYHHHCHNCNHCLDQVLINAFSLLCVFINKTRIWPSINSSFYNYHCYQDVIYYKQLMR